ncbi:MAG: cysteine--tRNA ligase [Phycisphaerae bacterium]|nr:MAG: cysteine--tRNA ligase [Phycisphaerae bacterium]
MPIRIYNSLSNSKESFETIEPGKVGMYLCGPTVYKPSHIGHAVGPVIFDTIKRYLTIFHGYKVNWVVNITDVEDKLIAEANVQGIGVFELAQRVEQNYHDALAALAVDGVDHFPKASENIAEIISMIETLISTDYAYVVGGDVYFNVTNDDDYGKLSNRNPDDQTGHRELASGPKKHPGDFALWKQAREDEPDAVKYDSPWGKGRPGWHIECSAMSKRILGDSFDIHGGGLDLIFPHHENEIAQSESCTHKPFAKYWMHHGLTRFNTKKVSKSDPEMQAALAAMTLSKLLEEYSGELLRFFIISTQYRSPIEYSPAELAGKKKGLTSFHRLFKRVNDLGAGDVYDAPSAADTSTFKIDPQDLGDPAIELAASVAHARDRFQTAMDDDFNTAAATAVLFELTNDVNRFIEVKGLESSDDSAGKQFALKAAHALAALGQSLGVFLSAPEVAAGGDALVGQLIDALLEVRSACRTEKCFELADQVRDQLNALNVLVEDKPSGATWSIEKSSDDLQSKLVEAHIQTRLASKAAKNFTLSDMIRDRLASIGVTLEDRAGGTTWELTESQS